MSEKKFSMTPGQLLTSAREARGLSQADIAAKLRLSIEVIKDIEQDAYAKLGVRTYVRGYLSSYSRLVDVAEKQILEVWEASGLMPANTCSATSVVEGAPVTNVTRQGVYFNFNDARWKIITAAGILFVIILSFSLRGHKESVVADNTSPAALTTPTPTVVVSQAAPESSPQAAPVVVSKPAVAIAQNAFVKKNKIAINKPAQPLQSTYVVKSVE